ncbi:MAG: NUDIX domain-containing protein [Chloroflexi bacterium]|nr:NUDIX domain-containing protein [Chloroflexota bacterium]
MHENKVLLIRRNVIPRIGYWALPSGFVEYDEQPRPALQREVAEETGLTVEAGSVMDVFALSDPRKQGIFLLLRARLLGGELQPGDDVSEAQWFGRDEIPWSELAFPQMHSWLQTALPPASGPVPRCS